MNSPTPSLSRSDSGSDISTRPTTAPPSPKLEFESNFLPSPFYPPSLAQIEGIDVEREAPSLPDYYPRIPPSFRLSDLQETDEATKGTPDSHVIRDPALVRLTGTSHVDPYLRWTCTDDEQRL